MPRTYPQQQDTLQQKDIAIHDYPPPPLASIAVTLTISTTVCLLCNAASVFLCRIEWPLLFLIQPAGTQFFDFVVLERLRTTRAAPLFGY